MDATSICTNSTVLQIIYFVLKLIDIIFVLVPIGLIVMVSVDIFKNVISGNDNDMKKNVNIAIKRVIMAVVIFFIPTIVSIVINLVSDEDGYLSCINNATPEIIEKYKNEEQSSSINQEEDSTSGLTTDFEENDNPYTNTTTSGGMGKALNINIETNVEDSLGRCGDGYKCMAVATVEYEKGTVTYYMEKQNAEGVLGGSCRSHAFTCIMNAINNTTYSTMDLENYLRTITNKDGVLQAAEIDEAIKHYNLSATVYHSETSYEECARLIKEALDNGNPVMIFVANSKCSDLAGTHHALFLLGYDSNGNVLFIDSAGYFKNSNGKRNVDELSECISGDGVSDSYYRMIIFNF